MRIDFMIEFEPKELSDLVAALEQADPPDDWVNKIIEKISSGIEECLPEQVRKPKSSKQN
jgi:hypothetical protein